MKKQYISDLKDGTAVETVFSVKYKKPVRDYTNGFMFVLGLADKTGEIELAYFGGINKQKVETVYGGFEENDVVFAKGFAREHKKKIKLNVNEESGFIRKAKPEEFQMDMFLYNTNQDIEKMLSYLKEKIDNVKDIYIKQLLDLFFNDAEFVEKYKKAPAAMYYHHACVGGLLEHTWGILQICDAVNKLHPSMDSDLLTVGSIFHDVGKLEEFQTTSNIKITEKGMLVGHVAIGADMVLKKIEKIKDFPEILKNKILHIIFSHHGELEYGALKKPQFPEAVTVHMADMMDSKVTQFIRFKKDTADKTEDFRGYSNQIGEIFLR